MDPYLIGVIVTALLAGANLLYTWLDKGRQRKWTQQDAKLIADDLKEEAARIAETIRLKVADDAKAVAEASTIQAAGLATKVVEGMTAAQLAIKTSNALNEKIADLTKQLIAVKRARQIQPKKRSRK